MAGKIGILAGGGDLPLTVAARLQGEGRPFHVIRLAEFADDRLARYPNDVLPMGAFGGVQKALKRAGCDTICLAGHVARPDFRSLAKDLKAIYSGLNSRLVMERKETEITSFFAAGAALLALLSGLLSLLWYNRVL